MNALIASSYDAANGFFLPSRRISGGHKLADLAVIGVQILGEVDELGYQRCKLPEGWRPVPAEESPMQVRLVNDAGDVCARIYYKPASLGAGASMELMPGVMPLH